eukprot:m51a1_g8120 hypothetical protein (1286) ;mRNA; r:151948-175760
MGHGHWGEHDDRKRRTREGDEALEEPRQAAARAAGIDSARGPRSSSRDTWGTTSIDKIERGEVLLGPRHRTQILVVSDSDSDTESPSLSAAMAAPAKEPWLLHTLEPLLHHVLHAPKELLLPPRLLTLKELLSPSQHAPKELSPHHLHAPKELLPPPHLLMLKELSSPSQRMPKELFTPFKLPSRMFSELFLLRTPLELLLPLCLKELYLQQQARQQVGNVTRHVESWHKSVFMEIEKRIKAGLETHHFIDELAAKFQNDPRQAKITDSFEVNEKLSRALMFLLFVVKNGLPFSLIEDEILHVIFDELGIVLPSARELTRQLPALPMSNKRHTSDSLGEQLQTAWLLRTLVVPHVVRDEDLGPLALSLPAALGAACYGSPESSSPSLVRLLLSSATARALVRDSALLLAVCAALSRFPPISAAVEAIVAEAASLGVLPRDAGAVPVTCESLDVVVTACRLGSTDALDLLGSAAPVVRRALGPADGCAALVAACQAGSVGVVRRLARPPYCLGGPHARFGHLRVLTAAASAGHADIVRALGQQPYGLGGDEADASELRSVLIEACGNDHGAVVDALAEPPFNIGANRDALNNAFWCACCKGCAGAAAALRQFGKRRDWHCMRRACESGNAELVRMLAEPPFSLQASGASLAAACGKGHLEVIRALARAPAAARVLGNISALLLAVSAALSNCPSIAASAVVIVSEYRELLQTAWLLRTLVVPHVPGDEDLGPLALSLPAALGAVCLGSPGASSPSLVRLLLSSCSPQCPAAAHALDRDSATLLAVVAALSRCPSIAASTAAVASQYREDPQLRTADLLRESVVPQVEPREDLLPLAVSMPLAVGPGFFGFSAALSSFLVQLLLSSCSPAPQRPCPVSCVAVSRWRFLRIAAARALDSDSALLLAVCAALSPRPGMVTSAARVVSEFRLLSRDTWCPVLALALGALQSGSPAMMSEVVGELAHASGAHFAECDSSGLAASDAASVGPRVLEAACRLGSVDALDVLCRAPFVRGSLDAVSGSAALVAACSSGSADAVRRLAQPPYSLSGLPARHGDCEALLTAVRKGGPDVVRALAAPPYEMAAAGADALHRALVQACAGDSAPVIDVLAQPPYSVAADSEAIRDGLLVACCCGCPRAVAALGAYGTRVDRDWLRQCLADACASGSAEVVRLLSLPPYGLGHADACCWPWSSSFLKAVRSGNPEVVRALASPPYSVAKEDVGEECGDAVVEAARQGNAEMLRALAEEPLSFGWEEAETARQRGLREAATPEADQVLRDPPYLMAREGD